MSSETSECEVPPSKRMKLQDNEVTSGGGDEMEEDFKDDESRQEMDDFSCDTKYDNYVTPEELNKLREFTVLDEVKPDEEDSSDDEDSDSSDAKSEGLPDDEIESMLEEDLPEGFKGAPRPKEKPYVTRQKIVLEEKGVNHWESLPLDWMMVRHYSGMLVYMHRTTRVCTLSKPYFLGKGNTRRHDIPISAIPCLAYRKALEEEKKQQEIDRKIEEQIKNGTWAQNLTQADQIANAIINSSQTKEGSSGSTVSNKEESLIPINRIKKEFVTKCPFAEGNSENMEPESIEDDSIAKDNDAQKSEKPIGSGGVDNVEIELTNGIEGQPTCAINEKVVQNCVSDVESKVNKDDFMNVSHDKKDVDNASTPSNISKTDTNSNDNETVAKDGVAESSSKVDDVEIPKYRQPVVLPEGIVVPAPKVENINTSWKTQHLSHEQVNEYCRKLFQFKTVNIMHFNRWADRRKYTKARKTLQYPTLPDGTKLITIPAKPANGQDNGGKPMKRDWVMNMDGRSYLSVFHEYVRRALEKQPVYEFVQLENAATPYQATVYIGGMQYGVGHGSSKRQAKSAAARASIHILIPEMKEEQEQTVKKDPDFSFFDQVGIEDPRISEFCAATCEPSPHAILRTCLLRNFGASDRHIKTEMKKLEFQKIELTMKVGKHSVTVACKNKKTAKQRASQAILQALHPHVRTWGSLLRLYGSRSVKSCKEKKLEEQQITLLQDKARHNQPNYAVLSKLRNEMLKLRDRDRAVVPIGTLILEDSLPTHSDSNLNNVDL